MAPLVLHGLDIPENPDENGVFNVNVTLNLDEDSRPAPAYDPALWEDFTPEPAVEFRNHRGEPGTGLFPAKVTVESLSDKWTYVEDNTFALGFLRKTNQFGMSSLQPEHRQLCERCLSVKVWSQYFQLDTHVPELKEMQASCPLCELIYTCFQRSSIMNQEFITILRGGSMLELKGYSEPILRLCAVPGSEAPPPEIQIGFPALHDTKNEKYFELLREWLRECDGNHNQLEHNQHVHHPRQNIRLPTRVLDVGYGRDSNKLRLHCPREGERGTYIALSHCWGVIPREERALCITNNENLDARRNGIKFDTLPKTFQDAITVTRQLGKRFLWIDSLCIVQGDKEEWEKESKLMETVFSRAYCTIAASSAIDSTRGFLDRRLTSKFVEVQNDGDTRYFVCEAIDDFRHDVEEGELNTRGWVLQERALARRTIHFTATQTYFECGCGVRCETLTRMRNSKANFLGDNLFPKSALKHPETNINRLYQMLYEDYSKLRLTNRTDRPIAIYGLEWRLAAAFETVGRNGIFDRYLHRSLLWQRSEDNVLERISYDPNQVVPSWSWMAYNGHITYMTIPYGEVEWTKSIYCYSSTIREYSHTGLGRIRGIHNDGNYIEVNALVRNFDLSEADAPGRKLVFDESVGEQTSGLKCVVLGRQYPWKEEREREDRVYYVLIVKPMDDGGSCRTYERVGAGTLKEKDISFRASEFSVQLV
ncbi:HET-domain-containing protein [Stipitochalara longipes BDJ]|nr:HET-domain-containing protein [Stipitochalara longipes BDJ]